MDGTVLFEKLPDAALKNKSVSFFLIRNSLYNRNKFIVLIKILLKVKYSYHITIYFCMIKLKHSK